MVKSFTRIVFLSLLLLTATASRSLFACNLSDLTLLSVTGSGPFVVTMRLCTGMGLTGSTKGGDQSTRSVFFGFSSTDPTFMITAYTPPAMTGPMGCTNLGANYGPDPYYGLAWEILYTDPAYYGDPFCTNQPYGCVNSTALCGNAQAYCQNFSFTMNVLPDSARVYGVEGGGNPIGGCYPNPDMLIDFTSLAVVWGNLEGIRSSAGITVKWSTLSETNADYFIVERSLDGVSFQEIGQVTATGTSASLVKYEYFDNAPSAGQNQYRIVHVDKTGDSHDSQTIEVNYFRPEGISWGSVGPNPASDYLAAAFYSPKSGAYTVQVMDVTGKFVQTSTIDAVTGGNNLRIDLANYRSGNYFLSIAGNAGRLTRKFVKL
jgi:hypothetical protein